MQSRRAARWQGSAGVTRPLFLLFLSTRLAHACPGAARVELWAVLDVRLSLSLFFCGQLCGSRGAFYAATNEDGRRYRWT